MLELIILIAILFLSYLLRENRLYCILCAIFFTISCISCFALSDNLFETNIIILCLILNLVVCSNMLKSEIIEED